jgi:hypothetical protein
MALKHIVKLDEKRFKAASRKARALGTTAQEYVGRLIDADVLADQPFDRILAPIRRGFDHLSDDELDELFKKARNRNARRNGR